MINLSQPWLQVEIWGSTISAGALLAVFWGVGEWNNVFDKMGKLGFPPPKWVLAWVKRAHDTIDEASPTSVFANRDAAWDELQRRIQGPRKPDDPKKEEKLP